MRHGIKIVIFSWVVAIGIVSAGSSQQKSVLIDLDLQKVYAMENGEVVFEGKISSGKFGYETPTGNFSILQKRRYYKSSRYPEPTGGANMPFMMRLTWSGIAMHQGYIPNKPASHGCIRLKKKIARRLFRWATIGTPVEIAGSGIYHAEHDNAFRIDQDGYAIIETY